MDELLADFIAETREMLEASAGEIVAWEADPTDSARLDAIFRFVHTVKGNCGFFDFPRLERLSHAAEDVLAECRAGRRDPDRALVNAVLAVIDRIGELTDMIEAGENLDQGEDAALIAALAAESDASARAPIPSATTSLPEPVADGEDPSTARPATAVQRSIRLPVSLLDEVMKGVSDLVLARNDLARRLRESDVRQEVEGPFDRLSGILVDVRDAITRMRMQRLEHLFGSFPRLVRDLSAELGKQVMIDFEGGDVEIDREMIEIIRDPLTHIIRNAIDHGIEGPGERLRNGKREIGLMRFIARQAGNQISLVISDDGRGIDAERLAQKAVAAGVHTQAEVDAMSEQGKLRLIFAPGLSTADRISAISGRGVGMDVVRANLEKVGGTIEVSTTPGKGTSFHLKLPLTLSIIAALTVGCAGQRYAVSRSFVEEIVLGNGTGVEFAQVGERCLVTYRNRRVPCIALREVLGEDTGGPVRWERKRLVLIRLATDEVFALAVDEVFDHEDVVVKPLAPAVMNTGLYAGTTLLDDGKPMLLLDIPSIAASLGLTDENARTRELVDEGADTKDDVATFPVMLFTALDGRRKGVRLNLVRRIDTVDREAIDIEGERGRVVIDGVLIPLAGHEGGEPPDDHCRLLRLSDGTNETAYLVADVLDAVEVSGPVVPGAPDRKVEGVVLIDEQPVSLIDGHAIFADHPAVPRHERTLVCRIPGDNEWARTILGPLVVSAGYRLASDAEEAIDVAILMDTDPEPETASPPTLIRLASVPGGGNRDTIYRYDREGLFAALQRASSGEAR